MSFWTWARERVAVLKPEPHHYQDVYSVVSADQLSAGCGYCAHGWAHGPGLVYRCACNPGTPDTYPCDYNPYRP